MPIPISEAKRILVDNEMTHVVIFAVSADGVQHVATYGKSKNNARQAAKAGNNLKRALEWPPDLCNAIPLDRICKNCDFYKADCGTWCANGWSGDGSNGHCCLEPQRIKKQADDQACRHMEPIK